MNFIELLCLQEVEKEDEQLEVDTGFSGEHIKFGLHFIIDIAAYSSLDKLLGVTGYVLCFIHNMKYLSPRMSGPLSLQELNNA